MRSRKYAIRALKPVTLIDSTGRPQTYVRNPEGLHVPLDLMTRQLKSISFVMVDQSPQELPSLDDASENPPVRIYFDGQQ